MFENYLLYAALVPFVTIALGASSAILFRTTLIDGIAKTRGVFERAAGFVPESLWRKAFGWTGLAVTSIFLTVLISQTGDWLLPRAGQATKGFGNAYVAWELEHPSQWRRLGEDFRNNYVWPGHGVIGDDQKKWEEFKRENGRWWIRGFRSVAVLGALVLFVGIAGFLQKDRRWGWCAGAASFGLIVTVLSCYGWAHREGVFVGRIQAMYRGHLRHHKPPTTPELTDLDSYVEEWSRKSGVSLSSP